MTTQQVEEGEQGQLLGEDTTFEDLSSLEDGGDTASADAAPVIEERTGQPQAGSPPSVATEPSTRPPEFQPAPVSRQEYEAATKAIEQQAYQQATLQAQLQEQTEAQELNARMSQWEAEGFLPEQIRTLSDETKALQAERKWMQEQAAVAQQQSQAIRDNELGRRVAADYFSKKWGVSMNDLINEISPPAMDKLGENMSLRAENAKLKRGAVAPARLDSGSAPPAASSSRSRRLDHLTTKQGDWTDAEAAEYEKLSTG